MARRHSPAQIIRKLREGEKLIGQRCQCRAKADQLVPN